jgi:hypothetical protein
MELPITRPSMICYADEIEFPDLLKDLSYKRHNGFIRITAGYEEGFVLFKEGKEIAASYDRHSRVNAIEKIKIAMDNNGTLIEIFDVRPNQVDFFMDMNKAYIIGSEAYDLIDELKKPKDAKNEPETVLAPKAVPKPKPVSEAIKQSETIEPKPVSKTVKTDTEEKSSNNSKKQEAPQVNNSPETEKTEPKPVLQQETESISEPKIEETKTVEAEVKETKPVEESLSEVVEKPISEVPNNITKEVPEPVKVKSKINKSKPSQSQEKSAAEIVDSNPENTNQESKRNEPIENAEMPPMDRSELMKKYGIKDIQEEDVDNILESYKGGSVSDEDVEKIELTLMNKIKKSVLGIPKIRGAEVMVFLENANGLSGKVNIMIESESKGFLSRIIGDSKDINLERQIVDISQIEIRKSFRKYPEIVEKFDVNVEIN